MQFLQFTAARADTGAVLPFAKATVYTAGTTSKIPLFDVNGAAIGNPATADLNGLVGFAAADGQYDVQVASADGSYTSPTLKSVQMVDLVALRGTVASGTSAVLAGNAYFANRLLQRVRVLEEMNRPYLPALTTSGASYYGVYSTERLVSGSSMALVRAIKPSDGSTIDLGAGETGIRPFEVENLRGSAVNVKTDKWYDQSGNGRDMTQATAANRPSLHESGTINGKLALSFPTIESNAIRQGFFGSPAISLSRADFTMFLVLDPTASLKNQLYFSFKDSGGSTLMNLFHSTSVDNARLLLPMGTSGIVRQTGHYLQASPHVLVISSTASGTTIWLDDIQVAFAASPAGTMTQLYIGADPPSLGTYYANWRCGTCVLADKGLSPTDVTAISLVLRERFRLSSDYDGTIVYSGTSRTASGQGDNAFTKLFYEQKYLGRNYRIINLGQDGQALSTTRTSFASREATAYDATKPRIYVIDDAINDLGGLGASSNGTSIYNTTIASLITAAKALGSNVHVILRTCLPQDSAGIYSRSSAAIEVDRQTLNALILANSAGADLVIDTAGLASMGTYPIDPDDATKYVDKLHLTALGNSLLVPANAVPIEGLSL